VVAFVSGHDFDSFGKSSDAPLLYQGTISQLAEKIAHAREPCRETTSNPC
jgi:hypothetical protein